MIREWTEVRIGSDNWRVEEFTVVSDTLWVRLEDTSSSWPKKTAMVLFSELASHVLQEQEREARSAYEDRKRDELGITVYGMSSEPPPPLPEGFWDDYKAPTEGVHLTAVEWTPGCALIQVPFDKLAAVLEALK